MTLRNGNRAGGRLTTFLGPPGARQEFKTTVTSFTFLFGWNARCFENSLEGCWMLCVVEVVRAAGLQPSWDLLELQKLPQKEDTIISQQSRNIHTEPEDM